MNDNLLVKYLLNNISQKHNFVKLAKVEIESFVTKLKHLLNAGYNASLKLDAFKGEATVSIHATLTSSITYMGTIAAS